MDSNNLRWVQAVFAGSSSEANLWHASGRKSRNGSNQSCSRPARSVSLSPSRSVSTVPAYGIRRSRLLHLPTIARPPCSMAKRRSWSAIRLLPMPASPTSTTPDPLLCLAFCQSRRSSASSDALPTNLSSLCSPFVSNAPSSVPDSFTRSTSRRIQVASDSSPSWSATE